MTCHPRRMQRNSKWLACLVAALTWLIACGSGSTKQGRGDGSAEVIATVSSALGASDVNRVAIHATSGAQTRDVDLQKVGGQWHGIIGQLPVGTWTFHGDAYADDGSGQQVVAFTGDGDPAGYVVSAGAKVGVTLALQQVNGKPSPFVNSAPIIQALYVSNSNPGTGERISLEVTAMDPDGNPLTYHWSPAPGGFTGPDAASTTWVSAVAGDFPLAIDVADNQGAHAGMSVTIHVRDANAHGSADVTVTINSFPAVDGILADATLLTVGASSNLTAVAHDDDGNSLTYAWSAVGCTGTFTPADQAASKFTLTAAPNGATSCTLHVAVDDGNGGTNTGDLTVNLGAAAAVQQGVGIDATFATAECGVTPGQTLHFSVTAHDLDDTHPTALGAGVYPAPRGNTFTKTGAQNQPGGRNGTYAVPSLASYSALYWGPSGPITMQLQASAPLVTMQLVSVTGNTAVWMGSSSYFDGISTSTTVSLRFTMTLTSGGNLIGPNTIAGLTVPAVDVLAAGGNFTVNTIFEANPGGSWQAIGPMRNTSGQTSSFGGAFYSTDAPSIAPVTFAWTVQHDIDTIPLTATTSTVGDKTVSSVDWSAFDESNVITATATANGHSTVTTFNVTTAACH